MRELTDRMRGEAIPVGEKLIERERALDQAFAQAQITPASLANLTARIGETQAELTLQLPFCFEVRALSGGLMSSTPA